MDAEDQQAFFHGLDRKAEKVNKKLAGLHEWIHSKIENLDYGTYDIGLDDPIGKGYPSLEKVMPSKNVSWGEYRMIDPASQESGRSRQRYLGGEAPSQLGRFLDGERSPKIRRVSLPEREWDTARSCPKR
ncbi:hypothetical protein KSP39_PZI012632 [Platanthera zijinensis]|uniref:Uncharacterized protein n=1 Tax=Platanthera zijinensis TaxID=2320716 RepID=A0AAP0BFI2_9ASPA